MKNIVLDALTHFEHIPFNERKITRAIAWGEK